MAFSNLIITLVGLGSVAYLMRHDVRSGGAMLKRNMRTIKSWLEEEGGKASVGSLPKPTEAPKKPEGGANPQ